MKLNPFSKKSTSGYYERIKAEFAEVKQQIEEAQAAANEAKADAEAKRQYAFELEQRGNQHSISEQERRARLAASAAQNRAGDLERKLSPLKSKLSDLRHILEGPSKLESARTTSSNCAVIATPFRPSASSTPASSPSCRNVSANWSSASPPKPTPPAK